MNLGISIVRPSWCHIDKFVDRMSSLDCTAVICQYHTPHLIRLCLESLLRFYPDLPILIVDNSDTRLESSSAYCDMMSDTNNNIVTIDRSGINSHGMSMEDGIKLVDTRFAVFLDSDIIVERGGWIEDMLAMFREDGALYATGSVMYVTRRNDACGAPDGDEDAMPYAHPSCSIYDLNKHRRLEKKFCNHGAPCVYSVKEALSLGYHITPYPIEEYVSHLSGASWTNPRTVWPDDHDVKTRPFLSFVVDLADACLVESLARQTDLDFEAVQHKEAEHRLVIMHGKSAVETAGTCFDDRFRVRGEYVCVPSNPLPNDFVYSSKAMSIFGKIPGRVKVGNEEIVKREEWQYTDCFKVWNGSTSS